MLYHRTADVVFRIPGFIFLDHIKAKVGHWDVEANPLSPPSGTAKAAVDFADEAMVILGTHYTRFNKLYNTFWHERKQRSLTTPEAARFVFSKEGPGAGPLTLQEMYATHMFLTQDPSLAMFIPSVAVRWTGEFALRPPQAVLVTQTVVDWMRKDDSRLPQFMEKCKKLVNSYRAGEDRSSGIWKEIEFSASDRTIIEFVRQAALHGYNEMYRAPQLVHLPKLLRPLQAYDDISPQTAFQFLNEIGIWPNWYNLEINRSALALTSGGQEEQDIMDRIRQLNPESLQRDFDKDILKIKEEIKEGKSLPKRPIILQSPTEMYRVDPCDAIRHDFGTQAIYAIDDPSASELDDAFSIEPVPVTTLTPEPSTWVHVHVADPTAILPPTHELALMARDRTQTVYLPERSWPMLPRSLTEGALSLSSDGRPQKVMTFSVRISDNNGEFLESKIQPAIVRNIKTLNYDDVDNVLSWDKVEGGREERARINSSRMTTPELMEGVAQREYYRPASGSVNTQDAELVAQLKRMQIVAQSHSDARLRNGSFNFSMGRSAIELVPYPLKKVSDNVLDRPVDYSKWQEPQISVGLDPGFSSPSRLMVAEYMIMAGRVAAQYSRTNGLPAMYRGQSPPAEKYTEMFREALRTVNPTTGMMDIVNMLPLRPYISGAEISTVPRVHWSMGLTGGYSKVTSPLRRYADMVSHWQIKNHLLKGAGSSAPIFDLETLDKMTGQIRDRERTIGMLEARSIKFWLTEMLRRRNAAGLSGVMDGMVANFTGDGYNVLSTSLGFQTVVKASPEEMAQLKIGDRVQFEVNNFNPQRPWIGAGHLGML